MRIRWFRWFKWLLGLFLIGVIGLNVVLYNHAYYFTHFIDADIPRINSQTVQQQGWQERLKLGFFGVEIPKSRNKILPEVPFKTKQMMGTPQLEAWMIPTDRRAQGVVVLFHGYTSKKSAKLRVARAIRQVGYHRRPLGTRKRTTLSGRLNMSNGAIPNSPWSCMGPPWVP